MSLKVYLEIRNQKGEFVVHPNVDWIVSNTDYSLLTEFDSISGVGGFRAAKFDKDSPYYGHACYETSDPKKIKYIKDMKSYTHLFENTFKLSNGYTFRLYYPMKFELEVKDPGFD
jgi:hypothetical protein